MVKGYSELINNSMMGNYTAEQVRIQQIISSSAEQMVDVLDNAIKLTLTERNRFVVKFEEVNVNKIIGAALRQIKPLIQVRQLELKIEMKEELPPVEADRRHLRRILNNLLSNACRFTSRGGRVTLRAVVQTEPEGKMTGPHLQIAVADNGVGIPQREIEHIFHPFYQVKDQHLDEKPGMGMGLAVVKALVELHNGQIRVESTEGVGSIFEVSLPLTQDF
jgi:two-component system cell cycle sensor histidine kinase PleC